MVSYCICLPGKALSPLSTFHSSCHMFEQNWTCFVPHKCWEYSFWADCCKWKDEASKICSDMLVKRAHEGQLADLGRVNLHPPVSAAVLRFTFPSRWKWTAEQKQKQSGRWQTAEVFNHSLIQVSSTCYRLSVLWSPKGMNWTEG